MPFRAGAGPFRHIAYQGIAIPLSHGGSQRIDEEPGRVERIDLLLKNLLAKLVNAVPYKKLIQIHTLDLFGILTTVDIVIGEKLDEKSSFTA